MLYWTPSTYAHDFFATLQLAPDCPSRVCRLLLGKLHLLPATAVCGETILINTTCWSLAETLVCPETNLLGGSCPVSE